MSTPDDIIFKRYVLRSKLLFYKNINYTNIDRILVYSDSSTNSHWIVDNNYYLDPHLLTVSAMQ